MTHLAITERLVEGDSAKKLYKTNPLKVKANKCAKQSPGKTPMRKGQKTRHQKEQPHRVSEYRRPCSTPAAPDSSWKSSLFPRLSREPKKYEHDRRAAKTKHAKIAQEFPPHRANAQQGKKAQKPKLNACAEQFRVHLNKMKC